MRIRIRPIRQAKPRPVRASHVTGPVRLVVRKDRAVSVAVLWGVIAVLAGALVTLGVMVL